MRSLLQLEPEILQLSIELRISLIQTLAASLTSSFLSATTADLKTLLLTMPNVGEDADFARITDEARFTMDLKKGDQT